MKKIEHIIKPIRRKLYRLGARLGIEVSHKTETRRILEKIIIPYYTVSDDIKKILFVGCDYYTNHYWKYFRGQEYWTIDADPNKKVFGSKNHIVSSLENLHRYFRPGYFDLIICNGVFGWGMNSKEQCEIGFQNCYDCLRAGGELVLGWNDVPEHAPMPLKEIWSLSKFRPQLASPLATCRYLVELSPNRHFYDFYVK
jgi:SAM-dependent methyltransferase